MDCPGVDSNIFVMTDEELMTGDFVKVKLQVQMIMTYRRTDLAGKEIK